MLKALAVPGVARSQTHPDGIKWNRLSWADTYLKETNIISDIVSAISEIRLPIT